MKDYLRKQYYLLLTDKYAEYPLDADIDLQKDKIEKIKLKSLSDLRKGNKNRFGWLKIIGRRGKYVWQKLRECVIKNDGIYLEIDGSDKFIPWEELEEEILFG